MPKRVVIAIDWSEYAEKAFDWYVYHLHRKGATVILSHYIEASHTFFQCGPETEEEKESQLVKKEQELMELRDLYEERLGQLKIDHHWATGTGSSPAEHILETAKEEGADMIVMGARGLGKIKKAILGSVSDAVIRKARVPVLICKWEKD